MTWWFGRAEVQNQGLLTELDKRWNTGAQLKVGSEMTGDRKTSRSRGGLFILSAITSSSTSLFVLEPSLSSVSINSLCNVITPASTSLWVCVSDPSLLSSHVLVVEPVLSPLAHINTSPWSKLATGKIPPITAAITTTCGSTLKYNLYVTSYHETIKYDKKFKLGIQTNLIGHQWCGWIFRSCIQNDAMLNILHSSEGTFEEKICQLWCICYSYSFRCRPSVW